MKLFKGNSKRTQIFGLITLALIVVLFGLNLLLSLVGLDNSVYIDLTPEGLYTVTDRMIEECSFINGLDEKDPEKKVKVIFCADPDTLMSATTTRVTYFMALKLAKELENFEVETVNVVYNPTAVAMYKATSLSEIKSSDVIVAYGDRYRIVGAENFWTKDGQGQYWSYNGEYRLATILKSVTLANDSNPAAYFLTGHGESYYDASDLESAGTQKTEQLKNLLIERGLKIKLLDLSKVDEVPSDCALLIINNPTSDIDTDSDRYNQFYYVSETEKIDRYLTKNQGALAVAKDPDVHLPILEDFLYEWGFDFSTSVLHVPRYDNEDKLTTTISAVYNTNKESYGHAIYGDFADLTSAPKTVFKNSGYIGRAFGDSSTVNEPGAANVVKRYASFLTTPDNAIPYEYDSASDGYVTAAGKKGSYDLSAVTTRTAFDSVTAEYTYSYVFCANSAEFFSNDLLGNASYANFEIVSALVNNMSRMDIYASTDLGGTSLNTEKYGGKQLVSTALSEEDTIVFKPDASDIERVNSGISSTAKTVITIVVATFPIAALVFGVVVFVKRKFM